MLDLIPVESNLFASIGHDRASNTMHVLYKRGGLYRVEETTAEEFERVLQPGAEHEFSVGKAFNSLIKGRKPTFKVEGGGQDASADAVPLKEAPASAVIDAAQPEDTPALPAEAQAVSRKSSELTIQAEAIKVLDPATQQRASEILLAIAAMRREIAETFKPMKDAAYKAHRVICDQEKMLDTPLAQAEFAIKGQIGSFVQEQQRLAREAEERAREEARLAAEEESRRRTQEQAIEQAIDLEARGNLEAAEAVLAAPAPVPVRYVAPAAVAPQVAQVKGVATRFEWDFRIVDFNKIPREYLMVNEAAIRSVVKATKGKIDIPGVEAYEKTVVAASRRG
jgi:hypothetical protein